MSDRAVDLEPTVDAGPVVTGLSDAERNPSMIYEPKEDGLGDRLKTKWGEVKQWAIDLKNRVLGRDVGADEALGEIETRPDIGLETLSDETDSLAQDAEQRLIQIRDLYQRFVGGAREHWSLSISDMQQRLNETLQLISPTLYSRFCDVGALDYDTGRWFPDESSLSAFEAGYLAPPKFHLGPKRGGAEYDPNRDKVVVPNGVGDTGPLMTSFRELELQSHFDGDIDNLMWEPTIVSGVTQTYHEYMHRANSQPSLAVIMREVKGSKEPPATAMLYVARRIGEQLVMGNSPLYLILTEAQSYVSSGFVGEWMTDEEMVSQLNQPLYANIAKGYRELYGREAKKGLDYESSVSQIFRHVKELQVLHGDPMVVNDMILNMQHNPSVFSSPKKLIEFLRQQVVSKAEERGIHNVESPDFANTVDGLYEAHVWNARTSIFQTVLQTAVNAVPKRPVMEDRGGSSLTKD